MPDHRPDPARQRPICALAETSPPSSGSVRAVTNTVTVYRSPRFPQMSWSLGIGFDDVLAVLEPGQDAPLAAADVALAATGLRRIGGGSR